MRGKLFALLAVLASTSLAFADQHATGVPALSSRPGGAYTLYLDFAGFNFNGTWGGTASPSGTPGNVPAYDGVASNGNFNATEIARMTNTWARVAEKYAGFNVNVTTVDPATGANAATDTARQAFYDTTAQMMHTVYGGNGSWSSGGGGLSFVNVAASSQNSTTNAGYHTNWVFAALA